MYPGVSMMLNRQGHLSLQPSLLQFSYGIQNVHPYIFEWGWNGEKNSSVPVFIITKGALGALLSWPFQSCNTLTLISQDNRIEGV